MIKKLGFLGAVVGAAAVVSLGACGTSSPPTHTSTSSRPAASHTSTSSPLPGPETQHVAIADGSAHYDPASSSNGINVSADYAVNMTWTNSSDRVVTDAAVIGEYDAAGNLIMKTTAYGSLLQPQETWHDNGIQIGAPRSDSVRSFRILSVTVHGPKWSAGEHKGEAK